MILTKQYIVQILFACVLLAVAIDTWTGRSVIGDILLVMSVSSLLPFLDFTQIPRNLFNISVGLLALLLIYLLSTFANPSFVALKHSVSIFLVLIVFAFTFQNSLTLLNSNSLLILLVGLAVTYTVGAWLDMLEPRNAINGIIIYHILIIGGFLVYRKLNHGFLITIAILLSIIGISVTVDHRAIQIVGIIAIALVIILHVWPSNLTRWVFFFTGIFGIIFAFFIFTGHLLDQVVIDELSSEWTNRTIFSGRHVIWPFLIDFIADRPFFGWGAGFLFRDVHEFDLSAHSSYLQIILQVGLVGLFMLALSFFQMWRGVLISGESVLKSLEVYTMACVFVIMLHSSVEVFLTQNLLVIGIPAWSLLGLEIGIVSLYLQKAI